MIKKKEIPSLLIFGSVFPLLIALLLIVVWFYWDKTESRAIFYLIVGLVLGLLIDLRFLKGWVRDRYKLPIRFIAAIYVFYNILVYGFFMGFPVFNVFLSYFAGLYFGLSLIHISEPTRRTPTSYAVFCLK